MNHSRRELVEAKDPKDPKVTVLMPVYNGEHFLREAVESILNQTFRDFEFLIINDGSTDGTRDIILSYKDSRIRLVNNEDNVGLTKSLNRGLELARGKLIARMDADDRSQPERLQRQVTWMDQNPKVAVLGAQASTIDAKGRVRRSELWYKSTHDAAIRWQLMFDSPFVHSTVIFRNNVILGKLGGYDEEFRTSQDYELWTRIPLDWTMANLPQILHESRATSTSVSSNYQIEDLIRLKVVLSRALHQFISPSPETEGWLDFWIAVNNPHNNLPIGDIRAQLAFFRFLSQKAEKSLTDSPAKLEIRRHAGLTAARIAYQTSKHNLRATFSWLRWACGLQPLLVLPVLPLFVAKRIMSSLQSAQRI